MEREVSGEGREVSGERKVGGIGEGEIEGRWGERDSGRSGVHCCPYTSYCL